MKNIKILIIALLIIIIVPIYSYAISFGEFQLGRERKLNESAILTSRGYIEHKDVTVTIRGVKCKADVVLFTQDNILSLISALFHKNGKISGCILSSQEIAEAVFEKHGKPDFGFAITKAEGHVMAKTTVHVKNQAGGTHSISVMFMNTTEMPPAKYAPLELHYYTQKYWNRHVKTYKQAGYFFEDILHLEWKLRKGILQKQQRKKQRSMQPPGDI